MSAAVDRAREVIRQPLDWYHSIELAPGVCTPGRAPLEAWQRRFEHLELPDLGGRSVLDIGAYDGFFSFEAEKRGAARVVAMDHYVWSADMHAYMKDWAVAKQEGRGYPPPHESRFWNPDELPGRRPFDAARALLGSKVEPVVRDFMKTDFTSFGSFDVVLFLDVLYHLEAPLLALRQVHSATSEGGMAVVETEAMEMPGAGDRAVCEFFPGRELNYDATNWWAPNARAVEGMCRAAGFERVEILGAPGREASSVGIKRRARGVLASLGRSAKPIRYRLQVKAYR